MSLPKRSGKRSPGDRPCPARSGSSRQADKAGSRDAANRDQHRTANNLPRRENGSPVPAPEQPDEIAEHCAAQHMGTRDELRCFPGDDGGINSAAQALKFAPVAGRL